MCSSMNTPWITMQEHEEAGPSIVQTDTIKIQKTIIPYYLSQDCNLYIYSH